MTERKRWAPDSWVKIVLITTLAGAFLMLTIAMSYRAIKSDVEITPESIFDIFDQFIGLFGIVVGYVLGSRSNDA